MLVAGSDTIEWTSDTPAAKTFGQMSVVDAGGTANIAIPVIADRAGTFYITATTSDGQTARARLIVENYGYYWDFPQQISADRFFGQSSNLYNHVLARYSMALSEAAYDEQDMLWLLGYHFPRYRIEQHNYGASTLQHSVAYTFARRNVLVNGRPQSVVFIVICGTSGLAEWQSNFDVRRNALTPSEDHYGFNSAMRELLGNLNNFMATHGLQYNRENNIILVTGHSRGAAVANLLAAELNRTQDFVLQENLFAYTFATPNTTRNPIQHGNIWNIISPDDFVTYLPLALSDWNFGRHGFTKMLPAIRASNIGAVAHATINMRDLAGNVDKFYERVWRAFPISMTTHQFFRDIVAPAAQGAPQSIPYVGLLSGNIVSSDFQHMARFFLQQGLDQGLPWLVNPHYQQIYLQRMLEIDWDGFSVGVDISRVRINSPVDVSVYDSENRLVGRIINNTVDETIVSDDVFLIVEETGKYIYLPDFDAYTIRITATGTGTMNFAVEDIDMRNVQIVATRMFSDVTLYEGRRFVSEIVNAPNTRLFVIDAYGSIIAEVMEDGTEVPLQATQFTITFNPNSGQVYPTSALTGTDGRLASLPMPTRAGYNFNGWWTAVTGGTQVSTNHVFTSNTTIYAHWTTVGNGENDGIVAGADSGIPQTGDSSMARLWIFLAFLSATALCGLVLWKFRKRDTYYRKTSNY